MDRLMQEKPPPELPEENDALDVPDEGEEEDELENDAIETLADGELGEEDESEASEEEQEKSGQSKSKDKGRRNPSR